MDGIQFVTNEKGDRVAVQIDLRMYGDLWEDVYDSLTARKRAKEPRESMQDVKARLMKLKKLDAHKSQTGSMPEAKRREKSLADSYRRL